MRTVPKATRNVVRVIIETEGLTSISAPETFIIGGYNY
jgi:hypothetical protein